MRRFTINSLGDVQDNFSGVILTRKSDIVELLNVFSERCDILEKRNMCMAEKMNGE